MGMRLEVKCLSLKAGRGDVHARPGMAAVHSLTCMCPAPCSYIALWILVINVVTWSTAAMLLKSVATEQAR